MCICVLFSFYFFTSRHTIMIIFFILIFRISLKPFAEMGPGNISFVSLLLLEVLRFFFGFVHTHEKLKHTETETESTRNIETLQLTFIFQAIVKVKMCVFLYIYHNFWCVS